MLDSHTSLPQFLNVAKMSEVGLRYRDTVFVFETGSQKKITCLSPKCRVKKIMALTCSTITWSMARFPPRSWQSSSEKGKAPQTGTLLLYKLSISHHTAQWSWLLRTLRVSHVMWCSCYLDVTKSAPAVPVFSAATPTFFCARPLL